MSIVKTTYFTYVSTLFSEKDVFQRPAGEAKVQNYFFGEWQDREK